MLIVFFRFKPYIFNLSISLTLYSVSITEGVNVRTFSPLKYCSWYNHINQNVTSQTWNIDKINYSMMWTSNIWAVSSNTSKPVASGNPPLFQPLFHHIFFLTFSKKWWSQISSTTVPSYFQFLFCYVVFSWTVSWLVFMLLVIKMNGVAKQIMLLGQRDTTLAVEMFLVRSTSHSQFNLY